MSDNEVKAREPIFHVRIPVERHISQKNGIRFNPRNGRVTKTTRFYQAQDYLLFRLRQARIDQKIDQPIGFYVQAVFKLYYDNFFTKKSLKQTKKNPNPIPERNLKIVDSSNGYQFLEDCLTKANIIVDDHFIDNHDGSRRLPGYENFIEISLYKIENEL